MKIAINPSSAKKVIAFSGKGKTPLGNYTEADLLNLAVLARQTNDKALLQHFQQPLPSLKDMQTEQAKTQIKGK